MFILKPTDCAAAYIRAAEIFQEMYQKVTGVLLPICEEANDTEDIIVIGSDAVQPFSYRKVEGGFPIRCGSDDYCILSQRNGVRNLLFLAGGRGRSTVYAVYDFFERQADCHYFWDGDVIGHKASIDITGLHVIESPRFTYRAIRYFAHRGLKRFQAEHWDFEEWKAEIDWVMKKRLNMIMLRIGIDDLFQKAFPECVDYPSNDEILPEALDGFDNRTTFWPLEYRGQLRKRILDYAFSLDLIHPEDCGTMTHWYSRTPLQFLEAKKPTFLSQSSKAQSEQTGLVWDVFDEENLKNYQHLTDTHIREYGRPEIFHTIGLAERTYNENRQENLDLKKYAYKRIIEYVRQNYPNAPLMIASWDFIFCLKPEEVREIVKLFDPENTIILDYTMDLKEEGNTYEQWDIMGKLPWIFGLFHGYQPQSHIHGDYEYITEKLLSAEKDSFCKGMAFWPELSHSDTLMLNYFTENAWRPSGRDISVIAEEMCQHRYGKNAAVMNELWQSFLPTMKMASHCHMGCYFNILKEKDMFTRIGDEEFENREMMENNWRKWCSEGKSFYASMKEVFDRLCSLPQALLGEPFIHRDAVDMARTILTKKMQYDFMEASLMFLDWRRGTGEAKIINSQWNLCESELSLFADILSLHEDYSLWASFVDLGKNRAVNPHFEQALKDNVINWYCRIAAYEAVQYVYRPEVSIYRKWVEKQIEENQRGFGNRDGFEIAKKEIFDHFCSTPLCEMQPKKTLSFYEVMHRAWTFF